MLLQPQALKTHQSIQDAAKMQPYNDDNDGEVDVLENKERSWFDLFRIVIIFMALLILKVSSTILLRIANLSFFLSSFIEIFLL